MPDVTISFTDAQWTRVVAASSQFRKDGVNVNESYLATEWKNRISKRVKEYEKLQLSTDEF